MVRYEKFIKEIAGEPNEDHVTMARDQLESLSNK